MAKLLLAVVPFLFLAIFVVPSSGAAVNEDCSGATCAETLFCETNGDAQTCKYLIGATCLVAGQAQCVGGNLCPATGDLVCACPTGKSGIEGNTKCSGASFVAASFLSMVAMFVTTRLL